MNHIFFGNDEYYDSGARTTDRGGYLNVANLNAEGDANGNRITPPQPNALMLNNGNYTTHVPFSPSPTSSQQFGFRDLDTDGIPDILDTTPTLTGSNAGSNPTTGLFAFSGSTQVTTIPNQDPLNVGFSNSQSAMTIDTISAAYYKLDGGAPQLIPSGDGAYDGYSESMSFQLTGLAAGHHTINVYSINNMGNASSTLNYAIDVVPEPSTLVLLGVGVFGLIAWTWRRR